MNTSPKRQRGLTFTSFVFGLALLGFFLTIAFKVGPIYLNHNKVIGALSALEETPGMGGKPQSEILSFLDKRFDVDYITYVTRKDIIITKDGNNLIVTIEYEVIEKLFGNLSVLVELSESVEVRG